MAMTAWSANVSSNAISRGRKRHRCVPTDRDVADASRVRAMRGREASHTARWRLLGTRRETRGRRSVGNMEGPAFESRHVPRLRDGQLQEVAGRVAPTSARPGDDAHEVTLANRDHAHMLRLSRLALSATASRTGWASVGDDGDHPQNF